MAFWKKLAQSLFGSFLSSGKTSSKSKRLGRKSRKPSVKRPHQKVRPVSRQSAAAKKLRGKRETVVTRSQFPAKSKKTKPVRAAAAARRKPLRQIKSGKAPKQSASKAPRSKTVADGNVLGKITHYFPKVKAGVIRIDAGALRIGQTIRIKGAQSDFKQKVKSLQINRIPVEEGRTGEEVGIQVMRPVHDGDNVYLVTQG